MNDWLRSCLAALALTPLVFAGGTGCSQDSCANVNCGSGVQVHWPVGSLPAAARYRLCVNGRCNLVRPVRLPPDGGAGANVLSVAPPSAPSGPDVDVRLELLDASGTSKAVLRGSGRMKGHCCPAAYFRVASGRVLVPEATT